MKRKILSVLVTVILIIGAVLPGAMVTAQAVSPEWSQAGPDTLLNAVKCLAGSDNKLYKIGRLK